MSCVFAANLSKGQSLPRAKGRRAGLCALCVCVAAACLAAPDARADGWGTTVRRIDPPRGPAAPAPETKPKARQKAPEKQRFSLRADSPPPTDGPLFAARAPLARKGEHGPYVGAGLATEIDGDGGSGALLGGVAAPFVADTVLFGEVQQLQHSGGGDERRLWLGVRTGL